MCKVKFVLPLFLLTFFSSAVFADSPDHLHRVGTIAHAVAQPNETYVYLDAVTVDKIKAAAGYFVIREPWDFQSRIVVLTQPPSAIRMGQIVDIEGTMGTLRGQRVILDASVIGYFDESDHLLLHPPFMKGFMAPTQWAYKEELVDLGRQGGFSVMDEFPPEPNPNPLPPPTFYASIADLLNDDPPDDTIVQLDCHPIESVESTYFVMGDDGGQDTLTTYYTDPQEGRVNVVTGTIATDGNDRILNIDSGPGFNEQGYIGHATVAVEHTIAWIKTQPDYYDLEDSYVEGIVSAVFPMVGRFYIQDSMRMQGIRVAYPTLPTPGDVVRVTGGIVDTTDGERVIYSPDSVEAFDTDSIRPLGMNNRRLGGGPFNQYTPGVTGGTWDLGGVGLNNLALFTRTYGRVRAIGDNCLYIDDGSDVLNDTSQDGLKVSWAWGCENGYQQIDPPAVGCLLQVSGVSACELSGSYIIRVLRVRKPEDIVVISAFPSIAITKPPGEEMHRPLGQTSLTIKGTASANGGANISLVEVEVVQGLNQEKPSGDWDDANGTTSWYCNRTFSSNGGYTIWARATNAEGLFTEISRNVTVSDLDSAVIYVKPSGNDNNSGESWGMAKRTVQAGINTADVNNKNVWVKGSSQNPYIGCFTLKSGVKLYGGFDGTENYLEQRDWKANETILDADYPGDETGSVVTIQSGSGSDTVIDGFTIRNGTGTYNSTFYYCGGGVYSADCSATVRNNVITGNTAQMDGYGGGVYCESSSTT